MHLFHQGFPKMFHPNNIWNKITHCAPLFNLRSLQGNSDAIQEDEGQDDVIKQLMSNDSLAEDAEPKEQDFFWKRNCTTTL